MTASAKARSATLKLVQTKPSKPSAPRTRRVILEGTGAEYGCTRPLPDDVQIALDRKARMLADEAVELIRESLHRNVSYRCFTGASCEVFHAEDALELISAITVDDALVPLLRERMKHVSSATDYLVTCAQDAKRKIDAEIRRLKL